MEEVIAKSAKVVKKSPIIFLVAGIISLVLGIALLIIPLKNFTFIKEYRAEIFSIKLTLLVMGVVFIVMAVVFRLRANNTPQNIITLKDGVLYFYDGFSCKIEEVSTVRCMPEVGHGNGGVLGGLSVGTGCVGSLAVVVGGSERVYRKIENVQQANDRLIELMLKCRERNSVMVDVKNNGE